MQRILLIAATFICSITLPGTTDACSRCGLFGNRCRFSSYYYPQYYPTYYQQPQYQQQPSTIVFNNTYPVPYMQGGTTAYGQATAGAAAGYSMSAQPYQMDVAQVFDRSARLAEVAYAGGQEAITAFNVSLQNAAAMNDAAGRYRANAAIVAAGLHANSLPQPPPPVTAATITVRGAQAQVQAAQVQPQYQYQNGYKQPPQAAPYQPNQQAPQQQQQPDSFGLGYNVCATCHDGRGTHNEPKDLVYDGSRQITAEEFGRAVFAMEIGKMPPAHTGIKLNPQDKAIILTGLAQMMAPQPTQLPAPPVPNGNAAPPPVPPASGGGGGRG